MVSCLLPSYQIVVRFDLFLEWTPSTVEQMIGFVNLGVVEKIDYIRLESHNTNIDKVKYKFSPDEVITLSPLLAITTGTVCFSDMSFTSSEWLELADNIGEDFALLR